MSDFSRRGSGFVILRGEEELQGRGSIRSPGVDPAPIFHTFHRLYESRKILT